MSVCFCASFCWATSLSQIRGDVLRSGFLCDFFKDFHFCQNLKLFISVLHKNIWKIPKQGGKSYGRSFECVNWETTIFRLSSYFSLCLCFRNCNVYVCIFYTLKRFVVPFFPLNWGINFLPTIEVGIDCQSFHWTRNSNLRSYVGFKKLI